mgnify:CR=1 FL=1
MNKEKPLSELTLEELNEKRKTIAQTQLHLTSNNKKLPYGISLLRNMGLFLKFVFYYQKIKLLEVSLQLLLKQRFLSFMSYHMDQLFRQVIWSKWIDCWL